MDKEFLENVTFDELTVGRQASLSKTLTQDDINLFAAMSGDVNPAHMDPVFAQSDIFHGIVGHGMWSGSLISTLLVLLYLVQAPFILNRTFNLKSQCV